MGLPLLFGQWGVRGRHTLAHLGRFRDQSRQFTSGFMFVAILLKADAGLEAGTEHLLEIADKVVGREFTEAERVRYGVSESAAV